MYDLSFIRLEDTLEKAFQLGESPEVNILYSRQVQLLPFDLKPYFQTTNRSDGISLGSNVNVFLVDCNGIELEINAHFAYEALTDTNATPQIIFRLAYLPKDFYSDLVYLKITSSTNTYYSNRFLITSDNCEQTSRIDYKDYRNLSASATNPIFTDAYDSVRLGFYFKNSLPQTELETYRQITTGLIVSSRVESSWLNSYYFRFANAWVWRRLSQAIYDNRFYIDFVWNGSTEVIEYVERLGRSNASENYFTTQPNENDVLVVPDVPINPPTQLAFQYTLGFQL